MIKQGLNIKLGQSLSMTPQLQQAIKLLQLSSTELEQEIQEVLDSNPLLERPEDSQEPLNTSDNNPEKAPKKSENESVDSSSCFDNSMLDCISQEVE